MSDDLLAAYEALRDSARALQEAMQTIGSMIWERGPIDASYTPQSADPLKYAKRDLMRNKWSSASGGLPAQVVYWRRELSTDLYTDADRADFERFVEVNVVPHYDEYPGRVEA